MVQVLKVDNADDPAYMEVTYDPGNLTRAVVVVHRSIVEADDDGTLQRVLEQHAANLALTEVADE